MSVDYETKAKEEEKLIEEAKKQYAGTLKLQIPIKSHDTDVTELKYDFTKLTGRDYVNAIKGTRNVFHIDAEGELMLFACAVEKTEENDGIDRRDVYERISAQDAIVAVQLSSNFFNASFRVGSKNISNK